jgi:uracil-DNA glycosylase
MIANCADCPYRDGKAIGTRGDAMSPIVFVGEAPGASEIDSGQPFVGRAGTEALWPAVAAAGMQPASVFIVNAVACRPFNPATPRVRTPSPVAIAACGARLLGEIGAHPHNVIVALGATAVRALTGRAGFPVTKKEPGTELPSRLGAPIVPTLHPAYILRRGRAGSAMRMLVDDLRYARRVAHAAGQGPR